MKGTITTILLMVVVITAYSQSHSEKINKDLSFEKGSGANALIIANINGSVTVQGYDGDKIQIEVTKSINAKTTARLEKGKADLQLGTIDRADTIILYIKNNCNTFGRNPKKNRNNWAGEWGYNWECDGNGCETAYDYKMDFTVKVPRSVNVLVSTINEGQIEVKGVSGSVKANNINGGIKLANLEREAVASTINGDVDIDYTSNPSKDCRFYSLNGDINALFKKGLAANLSFESFNGEFYTNINQIAELPPMVEKSEQGNGIRYKLNGNMYRIGSGGPLLDFETFNGNVYLREK